MKLPKKTRKSARALFQATLENGRINPDRLRLAARLIAERKPRNYLGTLKEIQRLTRLEIARHHAIIESSLDLTDSERANVDSELRSRYGADLTTELKIVPALLGGLRIRIGDDVFDGSVQGRIAALDKLLTS